MYIFIHICVCKWSKYLWMEVIMTDSEGEEVCPATVTFTGDRGGFLSHNGSISFIVPEFGGL